MAASRWCSQVPCAAVIGKEGEGEEPMKRKPTATQGLREEHQWILKVAGVLEEILAREAPRFAVCSVRRRSS